MTKTYANKREILFETAQPKNTIKDDPEPLEYYYEKISD